MNVSSGTCPQIVPDKGPLNSRVCETVLTLLHFLRTLVMYFLRTLVMLLCVTALRLMPLMLWKDGAAYEKNRLEEKQRADRKQRGGDSSWKPRCERFVSWLLQLCDLKAVSTLVAVLISVFVLWVSGMPPADVKSYLVSLSLSTPEGGALVHFVPALRRQLLNRSPIY